MKSKLISLSAISSALVAIFLTIGAYVEVADLCMLVIASVFVLLPLYYNSFKASFLTFLVGGVIAVMLSGFNFALIFPAYFLFFGLYPIVKQLIIQKRLDRKLCIVIGLVWILIAFYLCYFYYTLVLKFSVSDLPYGLSDYVLYIVGLLAVVFYFVYDRFIFVAKFTMDKYLKKILK